MDAYDSLIVLTDFEPDDICALIMLLRHASTPARVLIIVGEGRIDKTPLVHALIEQLAPTKTVRVVRGDASAKDYPADMGTQLVRPNADGTALEQELALAKNPLIVAIKPPHELYALESAKLAHATLAMYGSFNFRCMFDPEARTPERVAHWFNTTFKSVFLYESFLATGTSNSINGENAPELFAHIAREYPFLVGAMRSWNRHIVIDCIDTIKNSTDLTRIARNAKCIESVVRGGLETQMVLADMALVAALLLPDRFPWYPVERIEFNEYGYTTPVYGAPPTVRSILVVKDATFDDVVAAVRALI